MYTIGESASAELMQRITVWRNQQEKADFSPPLVAYSSNSCLHSLRIIAAEILYVVTFCFACLETAVSVLVNACLQVTPFTNSKERAFTHLKSSAFAAIWALFDVAYNVSSPKLIASELVARREGAIRIVYGSLPNDHEENC